MLQSKLNAFRNSAPLSVIQTTRLAILRNADQTHRRCIDR